VRFNRKHVILAGLLVLYCSAWLFPLIFIPNGLEGLDPNQRLVAEEARALVWVGWKRMQKLCVTRLRAEVLAVGEPPSGPAEFPPGWKVRVTAYGAFGLPYSQLIFTDDGRLRCEVGFPETRSGPLGLLAVAIGTIAALVLWPRQNDESSPGS
jgi:hypothetical protein